MEDKELFELCKAVYERTGWELDKEGLYLGDWYWTLNDKKQLFPVQRYKLMPDQVICPLYNSDYLLEKLPSVIKDYVITMSYGDKGYAYGYLHSHAEIRESKTLWNQRAYITEQANTPLKALLKLVIALYDAGVKL